MLFFLTTIIFLTALYLPPTAGQATDTQKGLEYITYNGFISGTFSPGPNCTWEVPQAHDIVLQVGVAGPWDVNPFWFHLFASSTSFRGEGITGLSLETAELFCYIRGRRCSDYYFYGRPSEAVFVAKPIVDLNKTEIHKLLVDGVEGYKVTASEKSAVDDGTFTNSVRFLFSTQKGCSGGIDTGDASSWKYGMNWANDTQYTYDLTFTNNTASFGTALTGKLGSTVLNFTGTRVDIKDTGIPVNGSDNVSGGLAKVSLNTTNPAMPVFTFLNGTAFEWSANSGYGYGVTAVSTSASSLQKGNKKWGYCIILTVAIVLLM